MKDTTRARWKDFGQWIRFLAIIAIILFFAWALGHPSSQDEYESYSNPASYGSC